MKAGSLERVCDTKCFLGCATVKLETGRRRKASLLCWKFLHSSRQPPLAGKENLLRKNCKDWWILVNILSYRSNLHIRKTLKQYSDMQRKKVRSKRQLWHITQGILYLAYKFFKDSIWWMRKMLCSTRCQKQSRACCSLHALWKTEGSDKANLGDAREGERS